MKYTLKYPSRKEMNMDKFDNLVSTLAEYKSGDSAVIGEIYREMFMDLSATNQEKWIGVLKDSLAEVRNK